MIFGVILVVTREGDIMENKIVYTVLGKIIDLFRAIPFVILIMVLGDVTKLVSGTSIGLKGSFFPLIVGTIPFFARQIEQAIAEIDRGLVEASEAMGLTPLQIMIRVYLRESVPSIIRATTITFISLIGLTAIVSAIGARRTWAPSVTTTVIPNSGTTSSGPA
ncbi:MAG: methionine ABC transporter permease [Merdibacter sp.]